MVLKFQPNERAFAPDLNNMALQLQYSVKTGVVVSASSPNAMTVDVAVGTIWFNGAEISVPAVLGLPITAAHPSLDRIDVVLINSSGVASVITGTPATTPKTASYDPTSYVAVARIFVDDGSVAIIPSQVTDVRVINAGTGGVGTIGKYVESGIVSQSTVSVTHNLDDLEPVVQCYDNFLNMIFPSTVVVNSSNNLTVTFTPAFTGKIVVQGGVTGGGGSGGVTYVHNQVTSSTTWTIVHNLGQQIVQVMLYDSAGLWIQPQSIQLNSSTQCTVTLLSPESGQAIVIR